MTQIRLNFTDEEGYPKQISVTGDSFYIGRSPENDLCISDKRLSRQHLLIERFGNKISVSDCNSSNGTTLNNYDLFETETLRDGDVLSLGGVEINVEIVSEREEETFAPVSKESAPKLEENRPTTTAPSVPQTVGGVSTNFFFIAPLIGLGVLLFVGGLIFALGGGSDGETNKDIADSKTPTETDTEKTPRKTPDADKSPSFSPTPTSSGDGNSSSPTPSPTSTSGGTTQTPVGSSETENVKKIAPEFMKRIARSDPNPFLENSQAEDVLKKVKSLKNSSALADGLRSIAGNKSQFETLANSKGLKPQFLAAAALNVGGNPVETAQTILPILGNLRISLGTDFADDCLIIMAAYNQGKGGDFKSLQQKIEGLSKKLSNEGKSVSSRKLRSIWFLRDKERISPAEFDNALNFLAIGVIMQNPKAFGVNAEPVVF